MLTEPLIILLRMILRNPTSDVENAEKFKQQSQWTLRRWVGVPPS